MSRASSLRGTSSRVFLTRGAPFFLAASSTKSHGMTPSSMSQASIAQSSSTIDRSRGTSKRKFWAMS
jgi:hypothetical protein